MIAHLPRAICVTACTTVEGLAGSFYGGISNVFPAIAPISLIGVRGCDLIPNTSIGIVPRNALAIGSAFQNLAGTCLIGLIHAAPDAPADEDPDDRACYDAELLVIVGTNFRSDYCPECPAKKGSDRLAAAGALADPEIAIGIIGNVMLFTTLVLAVAVVVVLTPIAMRGCPRWRTSLGLVLVFRIVMLAMTVPGSPHPRRIAQTDSGQQQ